MRMPSRIRYVTLDATGTLLRPRESIGATYVAHWHRIASASSSLSSCPPLVASHRAALERAVDAQFPLAFRAHAQRFPNFGRAILSHESAEPWWSRVILASLPHELMDALPLDAQRHELTSSLYQYYASGTAWRVFDDVYGTLEALKASDVRMAVISDFDERLPQLLDELELAPFFETVTTSWAFGETKPSPAIFQHTFAALQKDTTTGSREPSEILHVGDHVERDYNGARAVGAHARLLARRHRTEDKEMDIPSAHVLTSLNEAVTLVQ